jgi:tetratricopeptide (TPR) repeat protein
MNLAVRGMSRSVIPLALILACWGGAKIFWEVRMQAQQNAMRYHGAQMTRELRDQLGQGMAIALFSGFRAVVADFAWLRVTGAWEDKQWFKVKSLVDLSTTLQPRSILFWEMGGWHMAWNASVDARNNRKEFSELRRIKEERFWIEQGRDIFQRGAENNPERYNLWMQLAMLHQQKRKDYQQAAKYYEIASNRERAPLYLKRFAGYMLQEAGDDAGAYAYWKKLWENQESRANPDMLWDKIEDRMRVLEEKLSIPAEKRIFPNKKVLP